MKKHFFTAILFSFSLVFMACNNTSGNHSTEEDKSQASSTESIASDDELSGKTIHLTKETFLQKVWNFEKNPDEWVYIGDKPCIIDFYADWCKPCKIIAPIMEELAEEYKGEIYVYKIDTQKERELAQVFQVTSIPRVLFCPMEGKPQMSVGALPKPSFIQAVDEVLLNKKSEK
jgi:thioredoxin